MDYLCLEFVNSSWYINHKLFIDPMKDNKWLLLLAKKWNITGLKPPSTLEIEFLVEQRTVITELSHKLVKGGNLEASDISSINNYMKNIEYKKKLLLKEDTCQLVITPNSLSWDWFMAEVAASFALLYTSDYRRFLKICENPDCGWYFIDESKNHNRKWCDDTCSTLMKVRRFRQKQKALL